MADKVGGILATVKDLITRTKGLNEIFKEVKRYGKNDSGASTTVITDLEFAGYGDDFFNQGHFAHILVNANSKGNAPEGEVRKITDYTSNTGVIICDAFTANVETDDVYEVLTWAEAIAVVCSKGKLYSASAFGTGTPEYSNLLSHANANTFGAWVQVIADIGDAAWLASLSLVSASNGSSIYALECGIGAGAAEVAFARFTGNMYAFSDVGHTLPMIYTFPYPIYIPNGTRFAIQISDSVANANAYRIGTSWYRDT